MAKMASNVNENIRKTCKYPAKLTVSIEEEQFRRNKYPDDQSVLTTRLVCTMCGINVKHRMVSENNIHPTLEVLLCKKCKHFYDGRDFKSSPSVLDNYCRWCAKDRNLFNCSICRAKFCEGCIIRNFHPGRLVFQEIKENKWKCCICVSKPIWPQRAICAAVKNYVDVSNKSLQQRIVKCARVAANSKIHLRRHNSLADDITYAGSGRARSTASELVEVTAPSNKENIKPRRASENDIEMISTNSGSCDESNKKECVICWNNETMILLYPCGHYCLCKTCAEILKRDKPRCPVCRCTFKDIVKVYNN